MTPSRTTIQSVLAGLVLSLVFSTGLAQTNQSQANARSWKWGTPNSTSCKQGSRYLAPCKKTSTPCKPSLCSGQFKPKPRPAIKANSAGLVSWVLRQLNKLPVCSGHYNCNAKHRFPVKPHR